MSLRGKAAIIGVGSVKPERRMPGRAGIGVETQPDSPSRLSRMHGRVWW